MMVRADTAYGHLFHAAGQFCENQLKACSLNASIRRAYRHLFSFQKKHCSYVWFRIILFFDC